MLNNVQKPDQRELQLDAITVDPTLQPRTQTDPEVVGRLADLMREGTKFRPPTVVSDGTVNLLADGFHRLAAHKLVHPGEPIVCRVLHGNRMDAIVEGLYQNARQGQSLTIAEREKGVERLLNECGWQSDRLVAKLVGLGRARVAELRRRIDPEGATRPRKGADGRTRAMSRRRGGPRKEKGSNTNGAGVPTPPPSGGQGSLIPFVQIMRDAQRLAVLNELAREGVEVTEALRHVRQQIAG